MTVVLRVMWILGHYFNRSSLISGRSLLRDQIHVYCNCYPLLCNQSKLVHCVKLYTHGIGKIVHHLRLVSLGENLVEPLIGGLFCDAYLHR